MKEILVLSGKGGTGKTSLVGALALLVENKVLADCDVDAANLGLLLSPIKEEERAFYGSYLPVIDPTKCNGCHLCSSRCPKGAIFEGAVNPLLCEGCLICYHSCEKGAIALTDRLSGYLYCSSTPYGPLIHASLGIAEENSGKLVALVKKEARALALEGDYSYLLVDGPPGCACPTIASLSMVDEVLLVTEPTVAGIHDLDRVLKVTQHFGVHATVCINKYNLYREKSEEIEEYCHDKGLGKPITISFDPLMTKAMVIGEPVNKVYPSSIIAQEIEHLWERLKEIIERGF